MFKWLRSRLLWGCLLIVGGLALLLQELGVPFIGGVFWIIILAFAGVLFIIEFINQRANWWALIPGCTLLGLAATALVGTLLPAVLAFLGGALFLGSISLAFWLVYGFNREAWWAIIPGGVLATLAVVSLSGLSGFGIDTGGLFFLGLGLTFALVAVLPNPVGSMKWAWIPAAVLLIMGILISAATSSLINYVWPVALILGGGFLLYRTVFSRKA